MHLRSLPLRALTGAILMLNAGPGWAQASLWPRDPTWRLHVEQVVDADRWQGAVVQAVDRVAVRHRLGLDLYLLRPDARGRGPRLTLVSDLEVAADLGVDGGELDAQPDARRTALDAYRLAADLRTRVMDLQLGRHILRGAFGFDALDGASLDLRAIPHLTLHGAAGRAARRGWSSFGPDIFEPDGARISAEPANLYRAGLSVRDLQPLSARLDWRRQSTDLATQRDELAAALRVGPWSKIWLESSARYDLILQVPGEVAASLGYRPDAALGLRAGWRRHTPTFAADTIWNAFGPAAFNEVHGSADWALQRWRLAADSAARWFHGGGLPAEAPGVDAGFRVQRGWTIIGHPAHLGLEGRLGTGWGGDRHYADLFGALPVALSGGEQPVMLRARLGALWFSDPLRPDRDGPSGWGLLAARWRAAESIRLEAVAEAHAGVVTPYRLRVMTRAIFEDWW
jgi:hypothetical protein